MVTVDFNHVFFAYNDDKYVLKDIDYHFKAGATIGVLGLDRRRQDDA
jgi:ATP-binding cassette subfamily B multidrug efflux pump